MIILHFKLNFLVLLIFLTPPPKQKILVTAVYKCSSNSHIIFNNENSITLYVMAVLSNDLSRDKGFFGLLHKMKDWTLFYIVTNFHNMFQWKKYRSISLKVVFNSHRKALCLCVDLHLCDARVC